MSIKDAIKSIEEADDKLKKAGVLEQKSIAAQRDAARLREESQRDVDKTRIERQNIDKLTAAHQVESGRKEQELKNREVTLAAGKADLERNTAETSKKLDGQANELVARSMEVDRADRRNKEFEATLDKRAEKYKSIGDFITTTL